ncbi:unnamed protein product [Absidia cylindrospora]
MEDIATYLTWYTSLKKDIENDETNDTTLDWLFVTKCTLAAYGHILSSILQSTLPLSESLTYWDGIYGNSWYEAYYGIQSAPSRLYSLAVNTRQMLLNSSFKVSSTGSGIKTLMTSSDHILGSLFPMALRNTKRRPTGSGSGSSHHLEGKKSLVHVFRKLYNVPLPLALIRDEIQQKRTTLRSFRTQQATTLGLLIKQAPRFDSADSDSGINKQQQQSVSLDYVARGTSRCVLALTYCLLGGGDNNNTQSNTNNVDASSNNYLLQNVDVQATMDTIEQSSKAFTLTSTSPYHVAHNLKKVVDQQPRSQNYLQEWKKEYGPASALTQYWIPGLIVLFGGKMAISYVFERKEDIVAWTNDGIQTVRGFVVNWLWEPMVRVLDTIRFKDQRIGLSSKEGLKSDLQSLERMVVEFAKAHYHLSDTEITTLASQVRDGDISRVLIAYENEIKNPLRNAIRGDLIQTLLIQVQKTKVDVDMAMQALDKLLKSNELNFAFLAVAPSMLLTWASVSWLKNIYQKRDGNRIRQYGQPLKNTLRRIDRLFTLDSDGNELTCESQGVLLCELLLLRNYAQYLPTRNSTREMFMEDIRDLETVRLSKLQKKETITRMYNSWKFLA